jgi:hypothetical protein
MTSGEQYKYFAFISYSSRDTKWGKRLQRRLENYRLPIALCRSRGWQRRPLRPVFFAPTDIQPGGLSEELQERLKASRNLIVICSPDSAKSAWVGKEIAYFHGLGRTKSIYLFIIDGVPHSGDEKTECFNPEIDRLGIPEILGANINEMVCRNRWLNKERAYVQLITKLLELEFDSVWQRHKRRMRQRIALWSVGVLLVCLSMAAVWGMGQPVDISLKLNEASVHNADLPPLEDAVVTVVFDNEIKLDTIHTIEQSAVFRNIPHHFIGKNVRIKVECDDFVSTDTVLTLSLNNCVNVYRDADVYGNIRFTLWNPDQEIPVSDCRVTLNGYQAVSDEKGVVRLVLPLEKQSACYSLTADVPLEDTVFVMPCSKSAAVLIKSSSRR